MSLSFRGNDNQIYIFVKKFQAFSWIFQQNYREEDYNQFFEQTKISSNMRSDIRQRRPSDQDLYSDDSVEYSQQGINLQQNFEQTLGQESKYGGVSSIDMNEQCPRVDQETERKIYQGFDEEKPESFILDQNSTSSSEEQLDNTFQEVYQKLHYQNITHVQSANIYTRAIQAKADGHLNSNSSRQILTQDSQSSQSNVDLLQPVNLFSQIKSNRGNSGREQIRQKILHHLRQERRKKGKRNQYQNKVNGYWTKNMLQFGKKHHLNLVSQNMTEAQCKQIPQIWDIFEKKGITMEDYLTLYNEPKLSQAWDQFFSSNVLFRELMLSKAKPDQKVIYSKFLANFERAFRTRIFVCLSKVYKKERAQEY